MAFVSYEEHNLAKQLISNMGMASDNDRWMAKVRVLYSIIAGHVDVEEKQVFPRAKEVLYDQTENEIRSQYMGLRTNPAK
jgi:hemerythrin superfamily protein